VKTKAGHFDPDKFEDQYEDALKDLLKKKQEGKPIERPERPKPTNVVNLMDARRQRVQAGGSASAKAKSAPQRRRTPEKADQPKRKKSRRAS
jgi:DNA end-binding protein Ku